MQEMERHSRVRRICCEGGEMTEKCYHDDCLGAAIPELITEPTEEGEDESES